MVTASLQRNKLKLLGVHCSYEQTELLQTSPSFVTYHLPVHAYPAVNVVKVSAKEREIVPGIT